MHQDIQEILISKHEIEEKITQLGAALTKVYQDHNPLCVGILKGAVPFAADLVRKMDCFLTLEFMAVSSYGNSTKSSGVVRIIKDVETSTENRDVLIIEDIIDTGLTLNYLVNLFQGRKAKSVKTVTLLDKPSRRIGDLVPDYSGFQIPDEFVVGYGLDFAEKYRNLPYIGVLKKEVYQS